MKVDAIGETHDCAFLEPLALPPDLPPPVILMDLVVGEVGIRSELKTKRLEVLSAAIDGRAEVC